MDGDEESAFLAAARERVLDQLRERRAAGLHDTIVAVARSPSGTRYVGKTFRSSQPQFGFCAERHALNAM